MPQKSEMNIKEPPAAIAPESSAITAVRAACALIPPLFSLENFVAVNPFLGWSSTPLVEASDRISLRLGAEVLPDLEHYRKAWQDRKIDSNDIERAAVRHGVHPEAVLKALAGEVPESLSAVSVRHMESERVLNQCGIELPRAIRRFVSRSLADVCSNPLRNSAQPITPDKLYQELLERASIDKTFELMGVSGWRKWMKAAPTNYLTAINWAGSKRLLGSSEAEAFAFRLLGAQYGWASYLRGMGWNSNQNEFAFVEALCAALQVFDLAVAELVPGEAILNQESILRRDDNLLRLCLQDAYEDRLVRSQVSKFVAATRTTPNSRPDFQVMFCIDVRSEVMRRSLETVSSRLETSGFAGFFGVGVSFVNEEQSSPRCPVLLNPQLELKAEPTSIAKALEPASRMSFSSPGSFNLIETIGIGYIGALLSKAIGMFRKVRPSESSVAAGSYSASHFGLTLSERVALAESILTNSGVRNQLGRIVVLCGHGGRSSNNAHEASLDCGACGGHCGALNAQMAVEVLNDAEVREELQMRGYTAIKDVLFLAAQHDTSTDDVSIIQHHSISGDQGQMVAELKGLLTSASAACRKERALAMGIDEDSRRNVRKVLDRKANDWSEVRPEWGLARNASFIAARRSRTRGANLEGRTFLHDYDAASDTDDSILKLILSAPVVVASWINLQYFASTVNNEWFGCGTKALLNRIGKVGVISGNEGDLRPGLPIESVHRPDGSWFHDPVRLQVIVEAPTGKIDRVLEQVPSVADLVENGWLRLFALEPESGAVHLKGPRGWEEF